MKVNKNDYDFSGWATKTNVKCSDGRTIMEDAFKHNDGQTVPLVWNHSHNDPLNVLGHALLENRKEGVYAYCKFNESEAGKQAKILVEHGDVAALSIYANQLKQQGGNVTHGAIREVSLVLAGANPQAVIDSVMKHGELSEEEGVIWMENMYLLHTRDSYVEENQNGEEQDVKEEVVEEVVEHADKEETIEDVFNTMTDKQKTAVYAIVAQVAEDAKNNDGEDNEKNEGDDDMKQNVFDQDKEVKDSVLSHSAQGEILTMAKQPNCGSLKHAIAQYQEANNVEVLAHGFEDITELFPEYKNLGPAAPEFIERDQSWVAYVMNKVHKSPISRIRTRQMDIRDEDLRALGYTNREIAKKRSGLMKLLKRTTDPQTVYRTDALHRDDIIDITDFDVVSYQYKVMVSNLKEELALAFLIGDGREDADEDKISEDHIRSIWHEDDEDLYAIHHDVDFEAAKAELQGTETGAHFGENYIKAEAIITAALYSREKYKGSGNLDFFCTPHLLNIMLLARDLNGRRIYNSKADLAAALNVNAIHTVEQFEGKTRTTKDGKTKKLLGIFVNLADYQVGSTKGGEITKFEDFDIDFNQYKYLIETRISGALTKVFSAIVLEEPVTATE